MNMKKIFRITGKIILIILLLIVLFLLTTAIIYHIKLHQTEKQLKDAGYYHPVPVGDHALNVYTCGNETGQHTIVALAGWGDGEMFLGWRKMAAEIEQNNRLIFLDRAGYGLSDDTKQDITPENVVEEYRTALQNAGIEAPYLLMGHSLGGMYATYWERRYPDEIEAVVFVDGSLCYEIPAEEQVGGGMAAVLMPVIEIIGLAPFVIRSDYGIFLDQIPEMQREQMIYLMSKTIGTSAVNYELNKIDWDFDHVWKEMTPTDMPKLYISASFAYHTKEDFINDGIPAESLINVWVLPTKEKKSDDAIYEEALNLMEERRTEWSEPYYEKLGNCKVVELPGDHVIFLDKPDACSRIIKEFIDGLDSE